MITTNEFSQLKELLEAQNLVILKLSNDIESLQNDVFVLKDQMNIATCCPEIRREWAPRDEIMRLFEYKNTSMSKLKNNYPFSVSEIGNRQFWHLPTISKIFNENVKK